MTNNTKETVSYSELARRVGDCILNNSIMSELAGEYDFELISGEDTYCTTHETKEECDKAQLEGETCDLESRDVYQTYIITGDGADYLKRKTDEIVYYNEKLDLYLWGVTHWGTSWSGVFTEINKD